MSHPIRDVKIPSPGTHGSDMIWKQVVKLAFVNVQFLRGMYIEDTDCTDTGMSKGVKHSDSVIRKIPCRTKCQPTPILLPGKSHGWGAGTLNIHWKDFC